jgi:threonine/homoserine/homoserine lactone efflux protein
VPLDLLPFLVASVLVTVVPGADMALVTRQVLVGGTRLAQRTIFGNLSGLVVHGVARAAGLSALLVASAAAYTAVKLAGAGYLLYCSDWSSGGLSAPLPPETHQIRSLMAAGQPASSCKGSPG